MKIGVFCSSSDNLPATYYQAAEQLGRWIGENGHTLVYGGARCGLMESVATAVRNTGSINVIGVVPKILIDRNMVSQQVGIKIPTENLTDRKTWMMKISDIFVALPGSVGTLDEAFTVIGEASIGNSDKRVIFWNINGFWDSLFVMLDSIQQSGAVNKPLDRFMIKVDTFDQLTNALNIK